MAPDDAPPEDRRRAERVHVNAQFEALDDVNYVGDLSKGGVFLHTEHCPPIGSLVDLCFTVIVDDPVVLRARGRIVRHQTDPSGIGVEFTKLDDEMRARIDDVVAHKLPQDSGPSTTGDDAPDNDETSESAQTMVHRRADDLLEAHNLELEQLDEESADAADTLMHLKPVDLEILEDGELDDIDDGEAEGASTPSTKDEG